MPKKSDNQPREVTVAIQKADNVERGQQAHHTALLGLIVLCANTPDVDDALATLTLYTSNRVTKAKDALCTKATFKWLERHFGIRVTDTGLAKRGREFEAKGFTLAARDAGAAEPWYTIARDMAFKVPGEISYKAIGAQIAKRVHAGDTVPSKDALYEGVLAAIAEAKRSTRFADWCAEFDVKVSTGEVERFDTAA